MKQKETKMERKEGRKEESTSASFESFENKK
jgi:hypothetical protein